MQTNKDRDKAHKYRSLIDKDIECPHCKNDTFYQGTALLNTRGMTFLGLDWLNDSTNTLICIKCGNVQFFSTGLTRIE